MNDGKAGLAAVWALAHDTGESAPAAALTSSRELVWIDTTGCTETVDVVALLEPISSGVFSSIVKVIAAGLREPLRASMLQLRNGDEMHEAKGFLSPDDLEGSVGPLRIVAGEAPVQVRLGIPAGVRVGLGRPKLAASASTTTIRRSEPDADAAPTAEEVVTSLSLGASLGGVPVAGFGWVVKTKLRPDAAAVEAFEVDERLAVSIGNIKGWVRLYREIPADAIGQGKDYRIAVQLWSERQITLQGGIECNSDDLGWRPLYSAQRWTSIENAVGTFEFTIPAAILSGLPSDTRFAVFYEIHESRTFWMADPQVEERRPLAADIPYRGLADPACVRLAAANDAFPAQFRQSPRTALMQQMDVARRAGLFDVAAELLVAGERAGWPKRYSAREVKNLAQLYAVQGDVQRLKALLLDNPEKIATDDHLAALLATLLSPPFSPVEIYETLPSGHRNIFAICADPQALRRFAVSYFSGKVNPKEFRPEYLLAIANSFAGSDWDSYTHFVNAFLRKHHIGELAISAQERKSFVGRLEFQSSHTPVQGAPVSVIMSAFNAEATVEYAIESILRQTAPNVEVLVCDDRGSDGTLAELRKYAGHPRVRVFKSKANQGTYNIRTSLLKEAKGDFVTFQDSDDVSHPQRLELQLRALHGDTAAVIAGHLRLRPDGQIAVFLNQKVVRPAPVTCLARREAYEKTGYFRKVAAGGDSDSLESMRALYGHTNVVELPQPLLFASWSANSLTRTQDLEVGEDGYISPARRQYRRNAALQRLLGKAVVPNEMIDDGNRAAKIYREYAGVEEIK
ncbi:MAG: glycosyltransferase family 2 protein [Aestuariivirga sp.]